MSAAEKTKAVPYYVEERVIYRREIQAPAHLKGDALADWLDDNMEDDWTANGDPVADFRSCEDRTTCYERGDLGADTESGQ